MDDNLQMDKNVHLSNENQTEKQAEIKPCEVTDSKLIELSEVIFKEITQKHKLNEKKLRKLIAKNATICQNSIEFFKGMYKNDVIKELDSHFNEYKKLEVYQDVSKKLDNEILNAFNDIKYMEFNINESRFVENFKKISENITSTKAFLEDSKDKINRIYERISKANDF